MLLLLCCRVDEGCWSHRTRHVLLAAGNIIAPAVACKDRVTVYLDGSSLLLKGITLERASTDSVSTRYLVCGGYCQPTVSFFVCLWSVSSK